MRFASCAHPRFIHKFFHRQEAKNAKKTNKRTPPVFASFAHPRFTHTFFTAKKGIKRTPGLPVRSMKRGITPALLCVLGVFAVISHDLAISVCRSLHRCAVRDDIQFTCHCEPSVFEGEAVYTSKGQIASRLRDSNTRACPHIHRRMEAKSIYSRRRNTSIWSILNRMEKCCK